MSRRDEVNSDLVSVSVDGSHEDLGWHKGIYFVVVPQKPTIDLTATSNSKLVLVDTNDERDQNYQLSTTDDEKKIKYSIDPAKQSPSAAEKLRQIYLHLLLQYL